MKKVRSVKKSGASSSDFVAKLRKLADAIESGEKYETQIAGETISIPVRAKFTRN